MDAHDQLLLSEGVCRQLGIVSYHPDVEVWRGRHKQEVRSEAKVPLVRVRQFVCFHNRVQLFR